MSNINIDIDNELEKMFRELESNGFERNGDLFKKQETKTVGSVNGRPIEKSYTIGLQYVGNGYVDEEPLMYWSVYHIDGEKVEELLEVGVYDYEDFKRNFNL